MSRPLRLPPGVIVAGTLVAALMAFSLPGGPSGADAAAPAEGTSPIARTEVNLELPDLSHRVGRAVRLVDPEGRVVTWTALAIGPGDTYIDADNEEYEVIRVDGDVAHVRPTGRITLPDVSGVAVGPANPTFFATWVERSALFTWLARLAPAQFGGGGASSGPIAIYHTHSDESYVKPSGPPSQEWGEIYDVGRALKESLEAMGYGVDWSRNNHNPHDGQAYQRSRRTVMQLLRDGPVTMIDVHRDAVPQDIYSTTVEGRPMTKVRIVVGRQNPNRAQNLEYAKRIKAAADRELPGIIQGIFHAQGDYNQDVGPRMILLEFGTHINDEGKAIEAARTFARIIPAAAGMTASSRGPAGRAVGGAAARTAVTLLAVAGLGLVGYLWMNEGSLTGALRRIRDFFEQETGLRPGPGGSGQGGGGPDGPA